MKKHRKLFATLITIVLALGMMATASAASYTVAPGDSLWRIAQTQLGNGSRWKEIYEVNRSVISDPNRIWAGQVLTIPDSNLNVPADQSGKEPAVTTPSGRPIPMASVNGVNFNTLTEAIQVANQYPGSVIDILSNATYGTSMLTFTDVTINLNGYTITRTNSEARWMVGGIEEPDALGGNPPEKLPVVVINGSGTITDAVDATGAISTPLITAQYADITINNVTMLNRMFDDDASAFCLRDAANATLNNCDLTCCSGIKVFREYGTGTSRLTINGGTITSMCTPDAPWKGQLTQRQRQK